MGGVARAAAGAAGVNKLAAAHRQKVEAFFQEEQKKKVNPATITPSNPTIVGYFAELQAKAFKTLTASQLRRLRELTLQRAGTPAILIPDVSQRLKITSAQTSTIRTAVSSFQTFASTSAQTVANGVLSQYKNVKPKDQADAKRLRAELDSKLRTAETKLHPRIVAAQKIMDRKIELSLSAAQLKAWHSLLGQPFAFR